MLDVFDQATVCCAIYIYIYIYIIYLISICQIRVRYKSQAFIAIVICQNKYLSKCYICEIYARYMQNINTESLFKQ